MEGPSLRSYDAVVVGAGHNGLTAAAYLARAGLRTLVLERRSIVGGCCVTEEVAPGASASSTSYIASMLRPEVIQDLSLARHGLRMTPCSPSLQVPIPGQGMVRWWADPERTAAELEPHSPRDADAFLSLHRQLQRLARTLQPFFLEPPPDLTRRGLPGLLEVLRVGRRFRRLSGSDLTAMVGLLSGSLGEYLDRHFESEEARRLLLANSVYGKHGGPYQPGSLLGLLFHLLSGGEDEVQGFFGHVHGGMGAITAALAAAGRAHGSEIRLESAVSQVLVEQGRAVGVQLEDGRTIGAAVVLSNCDPKRTFLGLVAEAELPQDFRQAVAAIKMDGPCAKVNLVLSEEPRVLGMPESASPGERALFTLVPPSRLAEEGYDCAKRGELPDVERLWVDCVVASNVDDSLAPPGLHVMTCFVQFVPYRLRDGDWDTRREELGDLTLRKIEGYAPNVPRSVVARQVLTPLDLERTYGLTEGNIFHGDLRLDQLFVMRPVPGWARYRTPIDGLYLCGAGAHPGGGVTGAPGYNAAHQVLADRARGRRSAGRRRAAARAGAR
ncbi:MAG TPA: NAD(P)/FAD-dependent oxidoreductase [Candidatus Micrarchaeia archaeon]|nr:NAD(P)/FAD-dependent oxidoreductase [Candidatus Micrarchaeia archaeon]